MASVQPPDPGLMAIIEQPAPKHYGLHHGQGLSGRILDCSSYDSDGRFAGFAADAAR
jgi:hypothetical protein